MTPDKRKRVYTPDGLVVGFARTLERYQINIERYQILIRGRKPSGLKGARPDLFQETSAGT